MLTKSSSSQYYSQKKCTRAKLGNLKKRDALLDIGKEWTEKNCHITSLQRFINEYFAWLLRSNLPKCQNCHFCTFCILYAKGKPTRFCDMLNFVVGQSTIHQEIR
jgi:hypothetical protein